MLRDHAGRFHALNVFADVFLAALVFSVLAAWPGIGASEVSAGMDAFALMIVGFAASFCWPVVLESLGHYASNRRHPLESVMGPFVVAGAASVVVLTAGQVVLQTPGLPWFPLVCGASQFAVLCALRLLVFVSLRYARRRGRNYRNTLIIGSGRRARMARNSILRHPEWGLRIVGFVDDGDTPYDSELAGEPIFKLIDFLKLVREHVISEVIVACPRSMLPSMDAPAAVCADTGIPFTLLSDIFGDVLPAPKMTRFEGIPGLSFAPVAHGRVSLAVKRAIDVAGAAVLLAATTPILAVAAIAIRLTSSGSVIFRQRRCGLYGRSFEMLKLRTMCADAETRKLELMELNEMDGPVFKIEDDPRVTFVGRMLRRWSIDEIPQLWNVLRGEMSLVGPRPPIPVEVAQYETVQRRRLSMRPGLTCIWQVSGRNTIGFEEWVKLDVEYIDSWSLVNDLKLLLKTLPAVLRGTGAS
ncbi:MAG: sugar transferase [Myxococcales bacterium]|nr:sugar transferase [Myxococcales bacterium]